MCKLHFLDRFSFQVEDEMERMLENAHEKFVTPLEAFRKEHIGSVKKTKKDFEVRATKCRNNFWKSIH